MEIAESPAPVAAACFSRLRSNISRGVATITVMDSTWACAAARGISVFVFELPSDQCPSMRAKREKLRSLSDLGGAGISLVGPMAGRIWVQVISANDSAI